MARAAGVLAIIHTVITLILNFNDLSDWITIKKFFGVATASLAIILLATIASKSESWFCATLIILCSVIGVHFGHWLIRLFLSGSLLGGTVLACEQYKQQSSEIK
ncbi:MAG: hypothetical protein F4227_02000 [Gammaproteobacteria bacterium]|nr:hypothetical protein [Gammaproteobacteria bacterium]